MSPATSKPAAVALATTTKRSYCHHSTGEETLKRRRVQRRGSVVASLLQTQPKEALAPLKIVVDDDRIACNNSSSVEKDCNDRHEVVRGHLEIDLTPASPSADQDQDPDKDQDQDQEKSYDLGHEIMQKENNVRWEEEVDVHLGLSPADAANVKSTTGGAITATASQTDEGVIRHPEERQFIAGNGQ